MKEDGSIDYEEFYNFIQELDDMDLDDDQVKDIFAHFDKSGDGVIEVEEFANGLYAAFNI
jgi:Ca2+-binding EF-hand superfamily protein